MVLVEFLRQLPIRIPRYLPGADGPRGFFPHADRAGLRGRGGNPGARAAAGADSSGKQHSPPGEKLMSGKITGIRKRMNSALNSDKNTFLPHNPCGYKYGQKDLHRVEQR